MTMRDLSELNLNEQGRPVTRSPPLPAEVAALQSRYGVDLPPEYLAFLRYSNGGHPELDCYMPPDGFSGEQLWSVNRFYHLGQDRESVSNLFWVLERWGPILGPRALPFAADSGGKQYFLDLNRSPPPVRICINDENNRLVDVAPSFTQFIDGLALNPDMI